MKKILVVNDNIDIMTLLKSWLEKKTYEVEYTANTQEVLNIMRQFTPNLVIVDVLQKRWLNN